LELHLPAMAIWRCVVVVLVAVFDGAASHSHAPTQLKAGLSLSRIHSRDAQPAVVAAAPGGPPPGIAAAPAGLPPAKTPVDPAATPEEQIEQLAEQETQAEAAHLRQVAQATTAKQVTAINAAGKEAEVKTTQAVEQEAHAVMGEQMQSLGKINDEQGKQMQEMEE